MSVVKIEIDYWKSSALIKEKPEFLTSLKEIFPNVDFNTSYYFGSVVIDIEDIANMSDEIIKCFAISPIRKIQLTKLMTNLNSINKEELKDQIVQEVKQSVQIHFPGHELSHFGQVDWEEDACTEKIQKRMDDGWRIIACIPQAGQRRPDYVLGKN